MINVLLNLRLTNTCKTNNTVINNVMLTLKSSREWMFNLKPIINHNSILKTMLAFKQSLFSIFLKTTEKQLNLIFKSI